MSFLRECITTARLLQGVASFGRLFTANAPVNEAIWIAAPIWQVANIVEVCLDTAYLPGCAMSLGPIERTKMMFRINLSPLQLVILCEKEYLSVVVLSGNRMSGKE